MLSDRVAGAVQDRIAVPVAKLPVLVLELPPLPPLPPQPIKPAQTNSMKLLVNSFKFGGFLVIFTFICLASVC